MCLDLIQRDTVLPTHFHIQTTLQHPLEGGGGDYSGGGGGGGGGVTLVENMCFSSVCNVFEFEFSVSL